MAKASGFTINDNKYTKDTKAIDTFIEPHIFLNVFIKKRRELIRSSTPKKIDIRYNFRPDRLAYEVYGEDFWYPAILVANNLGSILQFKASSLGFECKIPDRDLVKSIINSQSNKQLDLDTIVDNIFK